MKSLINIAILIFISLNGYCQFHEYEWIVDNTSTNPGERIVAVLDAGSVGTYDGIELAGIIMDNNGNWGYKLPTISPFKLFVKYSGGLTASIIQSEQTKNIILKIRKISDSKVHLVADLPYAHQGGSVYFRKVEGNVIITLGNTTVTDISGELLVSEPEFTTSFSGKVSIDGKLAVNGKIGAKEVVVESTLSSWPDYVFSPGFQLMPLSELEQFLLANNHLPEIPSAEDVAENGQALGEMNKLLLKKVEELTLYVIELEKENSRLHESQQKTEDLVNEILKKIDNE